MPLTYVIVQLTSYFTNLLIALLGCILIAVGIYALVEAGPVSRDSSIITQPTLMIIVLGAVLAVVGGIGAIGSIRAIRILLIIYCIIVGILILAELGIAGYLLYKFVGDRENLENETFNMLSVLIISYRDDPDLRAAIDLLQMTFSCCGIRGVNDWDDNPYFTCDAKSLERCGVPSSCCMSRLQLNSQCGFDVRDNTTESANRLAANINNSGCTDAIIMWMSNNLYFVLGVALAGLFIEILTIVLAALLLMEIRSLSSSKKKNAYFKRSTRTR